MFIDPSILQSNAMKIFGFCITPFFTAIAMPSISNIKNPSIHNSFAKFITKISILSYAIYLVHWDLLLYIEKYMLRNNFANLTLLTLDLFTTIIFLASTAFLALFLYSYVEKPFLCLRKKYFRESA